MRELTARGCYIASKGLPVGTRARSGFLLAGTLLVAGGVAVLMSVGGPCGPAEEIRTGNGSTVSKTIGPGGGTLTHGSITLLIPPGALTRDTLIESTETEELPPDGVSSYTPIYRLEPSGLVFDKPITLTAVVEGTVPPDATLLSSGDGKTFEPLPSERNGEQLIGSVAHFSWFVAGRLPTPPPPDCTITGFCASGCCDAVTKRCVMDDAVCPVGMVCVINQCMIVNAATCTHGCFHPITGVCERGTDWKACGIGGEQCEQCNNLPCKNQACAPCGTTTCRTCCLAPDRCSGDANAGQLDDSCGKGGIDCQDCKQGGLYCDNGFCVTCNAAVCPNGCCGADGCSPRHRDETCGLPGGICQDCRAQGKICANGNCETCGPTNCAGCCATDGNGNKYCVDGTEGLRCGRGGGECAECDGDQRCVQGTCDPPKPPRPPPDAEPLPEDGGPLFDASAIP